MNQNEIKMIQLPLLKKYTNHIWVKVYPHKYFIGQILWILNIRKVHLKMLFFQNIVHFSK